MSECDVYSPSGMISGVRPVVNPRDSIGTSIGLGGGWSLLRPLVRWGHVTGSVLTSRPDHFIVRERTTRALLSLWVRDQMF